MRLTQAKPSDAGRLARILDDWSTETTWMPKLHSLQETERFLADLIKRLDVTTIRSWRGAHGFMARDDEIVHALYLAPNIRGAGWGKCLLDDAKAAKDRLMLWTFKANLRARVFYEREGFREVEHTDGSGNDEKLPDIRLEWQKRNP